MPTKLGSTPSYRVDRLSTRTTAPHGATWREIERGSNAVQFMERHCQRRRSALWLVTTDKGTSRPVIADIQKRITKLQGEHNLPPYRSTTLETRGGLHAHMVFIGNGKIAERLKASALFGADIDVQPVTDPDKLMRKYLAKERTPQAGYGREHILGGRLSGSHKMPGGGDRVRLSEELERAAIAAGYLEHWPKNNARRTDKRKQMQLRVTGPYARAPKLSGQIALLPEIEKAVTRLRDYGGGVIPTNVAREIEHLRKRLGLQQWVLCHYIGIKQPTYSNAIAGRFPLSRFAAWRLREVLLTPIED